jgi:hypothetical protein
MIRDIIDDVVFWFWAFLEIFSPFIFFFLGLAIMYGFCK